MNETSISWTNFSWNPWSGCKQISPGCAHCYALTSAENKRGTKAFPNGFDLTYRWHKLDEPLKIKKPAMIFVNSMSDLYLEDVPLEAIQRVFEVMNRTTLHKFQILTKRSKRLLEIADKVIWTPNIWQGVSVENQHWTFRIDDLLATPAKVKWLSCEPLLSPLDLTKWLPSLDWVVVGGESGPKFRKMDVSWARSIKDQCLSAGVRFFYKQSSGYRSGADPMLDGKTWHEWPKSRNAQLNVTPRFTIEDMERFAREAWGDLGRSVVEKWAEFNGDYFDGKLKPIPIIITRTQPFGRAIGVCSGGTGERSWGRLIQLNRPGSHNFLVADYNTLLHEMVHQFLQERGENSHHNSQSWCREIMRLTKMITGNEIWAGRSKTARRDKRVARINEPHPETGISSLPQKQIARWPHDGCGIDLGRLGE